LVLVLMKRVVGRIISRMPSILQGSPEAASAPVRNTFSVGYGRDVRWS
jgi:hypothetical protein